MKIGIVELICPDCRWPEFQTRERWKGNAKSAARWRRTDYRCARCDRRAAVQRGDDPTMIFLPPPGGDKGRWRAVSVETGKQRHAKPRSRMEREEIIDQAGELLALLKTERDVIQTLRKDHRMAGETAKKYISAARRQALEERARREGMTPEELHTRDMFQAQAFYLQVIRDFSMKGTREDMRLAIAARKELSLLQFGPPRRRRPAETPVPPVLGRVVIYTPAAIKPADNRPQEEKSCEALSTRDDL